MSFVWAIVRREVKSYFVSPLAYTAIAVFLAAQGFLYFLSLQQYQAQRLAAAQDPLRTVPGVEMIIRTFFGTDVLYPLMLIVPLLTMRLLAEERKQHTAELLLTAPMTTRQLITGKFLGSFFVLMLMIILSLWMPLLIVLWGDADTGVLFSGLLGALLFGAFVLAVGLFASSLTESPFVAAIGALALVAAVIWAGAQASRLPLIGKELDQFTPMTNLATLAQGVIDTHAIVYFISVIVFLLDLTARVVDSQRWR